MKKKACDKSENVYSEYKITYVVMKNDIIKTIMIILYCFINRRISVKTG